MPNYLAKDDRGAILQVSSISTSNYENLDGSVSSDESTMVNHRSIIHLKSYYDNNWITKQTLKTSRIGRFNLTGQDVLDLGANEGNYDFISGPNLWYNSSWSFIYNDGWKFTQYAIDLAYNDDNSNSFNPPLVGWRDATTGELLTDFHLSYDTTVGYFTGIGEAALNTGFLLADQESINMLLEPYEVISTIGGKLNIIRLEK